MHRENSGFDDLDKAKDRVMVSNNAKFIFDHIRSLDNEPEHKKRWIWELMQNAQDTAAAGSRVNVRIHFHGSQVSFSHDGPTFTVDDITHLIFHGTAKPEEVGKTGKFGTGFMTTHLVSKEVRVQGSLQDGRGFDFILDRRGNDQEEMNTSLNDSWANFKASIGPDKHFKETTFTYLNLSTPDTVSDVLANIHLLIPAVLVFSDGIGEVRIEQVDSVERYKRIDDLSTDKVKVICFKAGKEDKVYRFSLRSFWNEKGKMAIPIDASGGIGVLEENTPRVFIVFPLVGTEQAFPVPFLVHCPDFEPSTEREKLWLAKGLNTAQTLTNKKILEQSFEAYVIWVKEMLDAKIAQAHLLANLGRLPTVAWVDIEWYQEQLKKIILAVDDMALVECEGGKGIPLTSAHVPFAEDKKEGQEANHLWRLSAQLKPGQTPKEESAEYWRRIVCQRETFLADAKHPAAYTFEHLCVDIDNLERKSLEGLFTDQKVALTFVQDLVDDLQQFKLEKYWSDYAILPNQLGDLKKSRGLKQELLNDPEEIGTELKDIATGFQIPGKDVLLHASISITSQNHQLTPLMRSEIVAALVTRAKGLSYDGAGEKVVKANILLFEWLLRNERIGDLPGYPIKMSNQKWDKVQAGKDDPFLCPIAVWKAGFQPFADLFPAEYILAQEYSAILSDPSIRAFTARNGWLVRQPLYRKNQSLAGEELVALISRKAHRDALGKDDTAEWKMSGELAISQIAYLSAPPNKNIIDKVRSSAKSTSDFLKFIIHVLLLEDESGFSRTEIVASDGKQSQGVGVYPSRWLAVLKRRQWVKLRGFTSSDWPTAESFLPYFDKNSGNTDLYSSLVRPEVSSFLHFLGIGVGDLLRNIRAEGEDERFAWDRSYVSILMNPNLTPAKVAMLLNDPAFIIAFEKKKEADDLRAESLRVGTEVEKMIEQLLGSQPGFSIRRDPVGADYSLETDWPNVLVAHTINSKKLVIEIKSTRIDRVAMTVKQGGRACDPDENYILCVVPLGGGEISPEEIRGRARFVPNIGDLLRDRVEKVKILQENTQLTMQPDVNSDKVFTMVEGSNIRHVIIEKAWTPTYPQVFSFDEFVNELRPKE